MNVAGRSVAELALVDEPGHCACMSLNVCLDDNRHAIILLHGSTDDRSNAMQSYILSAVEDLVVLSDGNQNAILLQISGVVGERPSDIHARFLHEYGSDDKEYQQNEYHIDQRRDIDVADIIAAR